MADRWEYIWVTGRFNRDKGPGKELQDELNRLGAEGWEAIGMNGDVLNGNVLLKRKVTTDE